MKRLLSAVLLSAAVALPAIQAGANEYNTSRFLGAGQANAVNRGLARANLKRNGNTAAEQANGPADEACGQLNAGQIVTPGLRAPREVTVVIKGDVTNVVKQGACR